MSANPIPRWVIEPFDKAYDAQRRVRKTPDDLLRILFRKSDSGVLDMKVALKTLAAMVPYLEFANGTRVSDVREVAVFFDEMAERLDAKEAA